MKSQQRRQTNTFDQLHKPVNLSKIHDGNTIGAEKVHNQVNIDNKR